MTDNLNSANFTADGVLGLGFQEASVSKAPTIINNLLSQGQISSGVFAFRLASPGGELTIGGLNPDLYSGTPTYTPVITSEMWEIQVSSYTVGSNTFAGSPAFLRSVRLELILLFSMLINHRVLLSPLALSKQWISYTPRSLALEMRAPLLAMASTLSHALQPSLQSLSLLEPRQLPYLLLLSTLGHFRMTRVAVWEVWLLRGFQTCGSSVIVGCEIRTPYSTMKTIVWDSLTSNESDGQGWRVAGVVADTRTG
jgi:Eukaryotic aspartyl protease